MLIDNLMLGGDNPVFYAEGFRNVLEDAMNWLITHPQTKTQALDAGIAYRFESDFFGLCNYYNIPYQFHWLCMRMSGLVSPDEMTREQTLLLQPNPSIIQQMLALYQSAGGSS